MTLVKVNIREVDGEGKIKMKRVIDGGVVKERSDFKSYYMDLTDKEERELLKNPRFGFERCDPSNVTEEEKLAGQKRKLDFLVSK